MERNYIYYVEYKGGCPIIQSLQLVSCIYCSNKEVKRFVKKNKIQRSNSSDFTGKKYYKISKKYADEETDNILDRYNLVISKGVFLGELTKLF